MFGNIAITRDWMVSRTAQRVYAAAGLGCVAFFFAFVVAFVVPGIPKCVVSTVMLVGCLSLSTLTYAMAYFAYRVDRGSSTGRALWIASFVLLSPITQIIYYWFVYRRSPALSSAATASAASA